MQSLKRGLLREAQTPLIFVRIDVFYHSVKPRGTFGAAGVFV